MIEDQDTPLYFGIMFQALTQRRNIAGLQEIIEQKSAALFGLIVPVIAEGQADGDLTTGDPFILATTYMSLIQGLYTFQDRESLKKVPMEVFMSVLTK